MRNKGFTLVELMVVVSIISLLSVITFANYRGGEKRFALQRSAHQLAQDLRRAQGMAMAAEECPIEIKNCDGLPTRIPDRYGIEFREGEDSYILFADVTNNGKYESGSDGTIETIYLEKGVWIEELLTFFPQASKTTVSVAFLLPDPLTTIRDPGEDHEILRIQLTNTNNQTEVVSVNRAGLIEIE